MTDSNIFDIYGNCPVCNTSWDEGSIIDSFLELKRKGHWPNKSEEQLRKELVVHSRSPRKWSALTKMHESTEYTLFQCPDCECEFLTRNYKGIYYLKKNEETK